MKIKETYKKPVVKWCPITTSLGFATSGTGTGNEEIGKDGEINI